MTSAGLDWDREKWRGSVASKFICGGEKNAVKYADEIIVLSKGVQKYFIIAIIFIGGLFTKHYLPTYMDKKGENLATKEDVEEITKLTEQVQKEFNEAFELFSSDVKFKYEYNYAISCVFEMREQVAEMAGKNYGNIKAHRK